MTAPAKRRPADLVRSWAIQFVIYLALWFGLTGTLSKAELAVGVFCAAVAATLSEIVWSQPLAKFVPELRLLGQAWRLPWYALQGTWQILCVLARHLAGTPAPSVLRAVRFDVGAADDQLAATRRALAVAFSTATPTSVVIGIDQERGLMLFHQLQPTEVSTMVRNLGARP